MGKKVNISELDADAVRWRLFDLNVRAARAVNAEVPSDQIEEAIEQALTEVRGEPFVGQG